MRTYIESAILTGNYVLSEMEDRIQKMFMMGKITDEDMLYLLQLAAEHAKDSLQINVVEKLKELEDRIYALEHPVEPDYVIWIPGYVTKKGETVKYDYDNDGVYDLLRYDGGRNETSLKPGKIDGWHVVDAQGNILGTYYNGEFTPVNQEQTEPEA